MIFASKKHLRRVAAYAICLSVLSAHAFAYDVSAAPATDSLMAVAPLGAPIAAIAPASAASGAEGTVLSVSQVDTAAQAVAEAEAKAAKAEAEAAAVRAAAEEAARRALLTYQPVYGGSVQRSSAKSASEVITANGRALGSYKLTFYCPCSSCSGGWGGGTSSGKRAAEGRTIAVDPRKIPMGSRVFIEGFGDFIAEDVGGAIKGNKIDIYVDSHSRCYQLGVQRANVYIMD